MFVLSFKAGKKQLWSTLACVAIAGAIAGAALCMPSLSSSVPVSSAVSLSAETEEQRLQLLTELGYETDGESPEVREVRIPDEPDRAFTQYNTLQQQSGMNLEQYMGKRVKVYTYGILNSTDGGAAQANVYVYKGKAVAGDVTALRDDAVSQPLFPLL